MKEYFKPLLTKGTLAHAYLLEGEGEELAMWLAKSVLCKKEDKPCGECSACRRIDHANHPDVHVVRPDGQHIKIDQIRHLHKEASLKSVEGNKQIFILLAADKLNLQSANALLKFIEEPSQDTLIILVGNSKDNMLPTILSRVQVVKVNKKRTLETTARASGLNHIESLAIYDEFLTFAEFETIGEQADQWVEIVRNTFQCTRTDSVLSVESAWDQFFKEKSEKYISIKLIQSYCKSLWNAQLDKHNSWQLKKSNYTWLELIEMQEASEQLERGYYSNQHYLLGLEQFFLKVGKVNI